MSLFFTVLILTIMTNRQKALVDKYLSAIDMSTESMTVDDEQIDMVDAEYVKSLIVELMREYERANSFPSVDFWGQPL